MNLLLYAESKFILARLMGEPIPAGSSRLWAADPPPALPESLFAELGYFGALDAPRPEPAATADEADLDELFASLPELSLAYHW